MSARRFDRQRRLHFSLSACAAGFNGGFSDALTCCFSLSSGCAGRGLSLECFLLFFSRSMSPLINTPRARSIKATLKRH